ncbi:hypothetical protein JTE90_021422 [Oedothorax gibbosus]|uniref:G-protein coupled receptors family 1 profile domain-containing protein n=1 Tax=Oedothorax gibbosus TaxID=931172 RepID=A0AAV6VFX4_9ARAC|nr:hypothetical protein JTE90_021422 [Oedothorax gibbosus]
MAPAHYTTNDTNYNDTIELFEDLWNETSPQTNLSCDSQNGSCLWNQTIAHSEDQYSAQAKVYWALVMIPLPLVAVIGNILVILSVYKEKNLQSATNYFIVSLAFADLLVAAVVMPFAVYVLVSRFEIYWLFQFKFKFKMVCAL